jgi:hypothetical protein
VIVRGWIFVAPGGDDAAAPEAPFASRGEAARRPLATVQAAIGRAGPGVAVLLRAGDYRENVTIKHEVSRRDGARVALRALREDAPLVIAGADGLDARGAPRARILGAARQSTLLIFGMSHIKFHNLGIEGIEGLGSEHDEAPVKFIGAAGDVAPEHAAGWLELRRCRLAGAGTDAIKVGKARHVRIVGCSFDVEVRESMIDFVSVLDSAVLDCEFAGSAKDGAGAKAASGRIAWSGNVFRYRGRRFGETGYKDAAIMIGGLGFSRQTREMPPDRWNVECFDSVARHNLFGGEFEHAVALWGAKRCLVERNFIVHRGAPGRPRGPLHAWRVEVAKSAPWRNQAVAWTAEGISPAPDDLGYAQNTGNVLLNNWYPPGGGHARGFGAGKAARRSREDPREAGAVIIGEQEADEARWRALVGPIGPARHDPDLIHELLGLPRPDGRSGI